CCTSPRLLLPASSAPALPPSFPTRRSSDLFRAPLVLRSSLGRYFWQRHGPPAAPRCFLPALAPSHPRVPVRTARPRSWNNRASPDRKSTRLNSSHVKISYAVFCLKKKNDTK